MATVGGEGYFQYHAVPGNEKSLGAFRANVLRLWLRQIRRRSQRSRWTWNRFLERLGGLLPEVCILHPFPTERFRRQSSKVRTVCVNCASTGLCGGQRVNRCSYRDRSWKRRIQPRNTYSVSGLLYSERRLFATLTPDLPGEPDELHLACRLGRNF